MKKSKWKAYIAPIVISAILLVYFIVYFGFIITLLPNVWKVFFAIIPLAFCGVMIYVCVERIKEIRKGDDDDLSKY